ncbi:MAG: hypothetical protein SX243_11655 [Acidobacteriota bacterium]|nr:hypothetical protein [Acidobacteriota bacterium]
MQWFLSLDLKIQAAIVASVTALVTAIATVAIKDFLIRVFFEDREKSKVAETVFRQYADPLASITTSILWRFDEIFHQEGRAAFLTSPRPRTRYEEYKMKSTLFRLASLLGWIRAIRIELSFLASPTAEDARAIERGIGELEAALADGPHVELNRFSRLCKHLEWDEPPSSERKARISAQIERMIKKTVHQHGVVVASQLDSAAQEELCLGIVADLTSALGTTSLSASEIKANVPAITRIIGVKEAFLYRDWQSGIGDLMLSEKNGEGRRFDVIGFREFEKIHDDEESEDRPWILRLEELFEGLDLGAADADKYDARIHQLKGVMLASARLLKHLGAAQGKRKSVSAKTLAKADQVLGVYGE